MINYLYERYRKEGGALVRDLCKVHKQRNFSRMQLIEIPNGLDDVIYMDLDATSLPLRATPLINW